MAILSAVMLLILAHFTHSPTHSLTTNTLSCLSLRGCDLQSFAYGYESRFLVLHSNTYLAYFKDSLNLERTKKQMQLRDAKVAFDVDVSRGDCQGVEITGAKGELWKFFWGDGEKAEDPEVIHGWVDKLGWLAGNARLG